MATVSIFPMNPLSASVKKGEIKDRYFNPADVFDRVQIVCPASESIPVEPIQATAGRAQVAILAAGWADRVSWRRFFLLRAFLNSELKALLPKVAGAEPDVTRAFDPQLSGWFAVQCARQLRIPCVISLHANYDRDVREYSLRSGKFRQYLANLLLGALIEHETIAGADVVICAYRFPMQYARRYGARRIEVIYNKVDRQRFHPVSRTADRPFTILSVGRLVAQKNHEVLIRALVGLDAHLRIVGDGELYAHLLSLGNQLGVAERLSFVRSVPHARIHEEYEQADAFATGNRAGGVAIPVLEAMASGLPLVVPRPLWEPEPELVADVALVVENRPEAFRLALTRLRNDPELRARLGLLSRKRAEEVDGTKMERRERALYEELLAARSSAKGTSG